MPTGQSDHVSGHISTTWSFEQSAVLKPLTLAVTKLSLLAATSLLFFNPHFAEQLCFTDRGMSDMPFCCSSGVICYLFIIFYTWLLSFPFPCPLAVCMYCSINMLVVFLSPYSTFTCGCACSRVTRRGSSAADCLHSDADKYRSLFLPCLISSECLSILQHRDEWPSVPRHRESLVRQAPLRWSWKVLLWRGQWPCHTTATGKCYFRDTCRAANWILHGLEIVGGAGQ